MCVAPLFSLELLTHDGRTFLLTHTHIHFKYSHMSFVTGFGRSLHVRAVFFQDLFIVVKLM